jgi:hypothetical protein
VYVSACDNAQGLLVGIMSTVPSFDDDLDHEQYLESGIRQQREVAPLRRSAALVLIVDAAYPRPSARWRKRIAEVRDTSPFDTYHFALVTTSSVIRGVLTAINWLSKSTPAFQSDAFATFELAQRWVEQQRGAPIPTLAKLHARCLAEVASKTAPGSRPAPARRSASDA